jgi:tetratricopeptide (TPR) repeat protein
MAVSLHNANPDFATYVRLLIELHRLIAEDNDDGEEAELLRDQMDAPWGHLSRQELALVSGLSADLYMVGENRPHAGNVPCEITERINESMQREDWSQTLALLRENEARLRAWDVAFFRGVCWAHLQQPDAGIVFFHEAARLRPLAPDEEIWLLRCMIDAGRVAEALPRATEIASCESNPLLLFQAADVFFARAWQPDVDDSVAMRSEGINLARRALDQTKDREHDEMLRLFRRSALLQLAIEYDRLGETEAGVAACEEVLRMDPRDLDAIVFRDSLKREAHPDDFRRDFANRIAARRELPFPAAVSSAGNIH